MKLPLQITYRNIRQSPALESLIREQAARLDTCYRSVMRCHVLVERVHRHHRKGNPFQVRVDLTVPGEEIVVTREASLYPGLRDVEAERLTKSDETGSVRTHAHVAVREAFALARRRLQDFARRQRGDVKLHEPPLHGTVLRKAGDHGWIRTPDERDVYFHAHSVLEAGFEGLEVGSQVSFVEEPGDKGPQASTVRPLGKHHYV